MNTNYKKISSIILYAIVAHSSYIVSMDQQPNPQITTSAIYELVPTKLCVPLNSLAGSISLYLQGCYEPLSKKDSISTLQKDINIKRKHVCTCISQLSLSAEDKESIISVLDLYCHPFDKYLQDTAQSINDQLNNPLSEVLMIAEKQSPIYQQQLQVFFHPSDQALLAKQVQTCLELRHKYHRLFNPETSLGQDRDIFQNGPMHLEELMKIIKGIFCSKDPIIPILQEYLKRHDGLYSLNKNFGL